MKDVIKLYPKAKFSNRDLWRGHAVQYPGGLVALEKNLAARFQFKDREHPGKKITPNDKFTVVAIWSFKKANTPTAIYGDFDMKKDPKPGKNESVELDEAVRPNDKVFVKGKNRDGKTISYFAFGGSFKEVKAFRRAIKKLLSDHAQKKFDVYVDGNSDLVDSDSSKTIVRFDDKMTVADVAKAVEEFINKEYPPKKAAPIVDYKTDTRTIITTDDEKAKELKNKYHGKGTKVRIMKRKSANKVYIDSKTPEIHKAINDALADEMTGK